ncbi:MAG: hypothetical protein AAGD92_03850 [Pseudomonadota bacterium]
MNQLRANSWLTRTRLALLAAAAAFFSLQVITAAHAAEYGDEPHEHAGQACILSFASIGDDKWAPASAFLFVGLLIIWRRSESFARSEIAHAPIRAAAPRGPPSC